MGAVLIYLWCTAPGCWDLPNNHPDRWRWVYGQPLPAVVRRILTRVAKTPGVVEIRAQDDDIHFIGECDLDPSQGMFPLATIMSGATFEEVAEAHQDLIEAGWRPKNLSSTTQGKAVA